MVTTYEIETLSTGEAFLVTYEDGEQVRASHFRTEHDAEMKLAELQTIN